MRTYSKLMYSMKIAIVTMLAERRDHLGRQVHGLRLAVLEIRHQANVLCILAPSLTSHRRTDHSGKTKSRFG